MPPIAPFYQDYYEQIDNLMENYYLERTKTSLYTLFLAKEVRRKEAPSLWLILTHVWMK